MLKSTHHLEKGTILPAVAVGTNMSYGDMTYLHFMVRAILTNGTASLVIGISSDTYNLRRKLILKIEYL